MSQKLHSKLLSVILCIAICCATLCGSIIGVNAAAADYNGTYTISVGDDKQAVPFAATEVKAQVKFDLPAGFVGGQFTAIAQSTYTIGDEFTAVAATKKDGTALTADELKTVEIVTRANGSNKDIRFVIGDGGTLCTSITIEYTLLMSSYVSNGPTTKYEVAIEVDGANFGVEGDYADVTFTGSNSWFHSHSSWYGTNGVVLDAEKNGKHTVTLGNARCHWCTTSVADGGLGLDVNDNYIPQVLPDYTEFDGVTTPLFPSDDTDGDAHTSWIGISGVTVSYNDDGTLDVDVHAYSQYRTGNNDKVVILVCDTEGNELYRLPAVANGTSYFAGNGFPTTEKMFTITGLSARDIDTQLLLTAVEYSNGDIEHSRTLSFCLADYCQNVVEGNAVWTNNATDAQIEADKDLAAALYYYGASIDESVFDKNTSAEGGNSSSIEYINKTVDTWDGTQVEPTATDADGNILINTAEELAWIALRGDAATAGKSYKVADGVGAFYLTPNGAASYDNSSFDRLKETLTATTDLKGATLNKWVCKSYVAAVGGWASFQGSFDGNGITIYGLPGQSTDSGSNGLFPYIKGDVSFKNIKITDSYISSNNNVGAIFGSTFNNANTLNSISVEKCFVVGNYLEQAKAGTANGWNNVAGLGGSIGVVTKSVLVDNCAIVDNHIVNASAVNNMKTRAFFGNFLNYDTAVVTVSIKNSFTDLNTYANGYYPNNSANYSNIYTTNTETADYYTGHDVTVLSSTDDMKGATSLSTMSLEKNVWVANNSYPEISAFHSLINVSVDNDTHKTICLHKFDGKACEFSGALQNHILIKNEAGTEKICECGYSEKVIGNVVTLKNKTTAKWDGTRTSTFAASGITGDGLENSPYIISTPAQLFYVTQYAGDETIGKYYKVSDDVAKFDFANINWGLADNSKVFKGVFDGNGVEIINFTASGYHGALFPNIGGNVTIKNIKVNGAKATSSSGQAGGIYGNVQSGSTILISNCIVVDCTVSTSNSGCIGSIGGVTSGAILTVENCYVSSAYSNARIIGYCNNSGHILTNSIINDVVNDQFTTKTNVYTETTAKTGAGAVTSMGFGDAWFDTASYPELYAFHDMIDIYVDESTHKSVCQHYINDTQCTTCGLTVEHEMITNTAGDAKVCSCGYSIEINGNAIIPNQKISITWDGKTRTPITAADMDENGTYIITTAEQLAWLAVSGGSNTAGNTYKVADNIGAIYINAGYDNSNFENLKASLTSNDYWHTLNPAATAFQGTFDGNGVTIYGFRSNDGASAGGLFPFIAGDVTFKNINIKDSYVTGSGNIGVLSGGGNPNETSPVNSITVENCTISDNYIERTKNPSYGHGWSNIGGLIGWAGKVTGSVYINNCSVYDNKIDNNTTQKVRAFLGGITQNGVQVNGNYTWPTEINISNSFSNLDVYNTQQYTNQPQYFNNVYTTADVSGNSTANGTFTDSNIKVLSSASDMQGIGAIETMNLDSTKWFDTAGYPQLHVFHDMATVTIDATTHQYVCQVFVDGTQCTTCRAAVSHTMVDSEDGKKSECECGYSYEIKGIHAMGLPTSILNRITSNSVYAEKFATNALFKSAYNEDIYGTQVQENVFDMYTTSLNLKVNPHIGFMFAFHGDYKTNRANITVTFTVDGETYTTEAVETSGVLGTNWVNNSGAGRYHLYRFKQLPISKLCKDVKVAVNYNGSAYDFGTYSAAGYAINAMNAGEDYMYHVNASMALVYYSEMLAARLSA